MTYKGALDLSLPSYVRTRDTQTRNKWVSLYNKAESKYGQTKAILLANHWLKTSAPKQRFIARSAISFSLDTRKGFIKRDDNGNDYVTFVLNSTAPHKDGKRFSESMLQQWAKDINANAKVVGDIDHKLYYTLMNSAYSNEEIKLLLKSKKGIAKAMHAIYEKGKLWVRALIDKRYKKIIQNAKGVSAEAFCDWEGNTATSGEILGFTFNVNTSPADYNAGVVA